MHRLARYYVERGAASQAWLDGFDAFAHGEAIRYRSALPGVEDARIVRASDGRSAVEWTTASVPHGLFAQRATFVWLAGLGCNLGEEPFDLRVNDEPLLTFRSSVAPAWSIEGVGRAELRFEALHTDEHGDHFGYMQLSLPASELWPDAPVTLRVSGQASGSAAWFMVHAAQSVLEPFHRAAEDGFWYRLAHDPEVGALEVLAPRAWQGRSIEVVLDGHASGAVELIARGSVCVARLAVLPPASGAVEVRVDGDLLDRVDEIADVQEVLRVEETGRVLLRTPGGADGAVLEASATYAFGLGHALLATAAGPFAGGAVVLVSSSHQDVGWMETPEVCAAWRDERVLSPALELLSARAGFRYSVEQTYQLEEYLARRPEQRDALLRATREGRLTWGATHNQPLEGAQSGEALCRQLYLGRRRLRRLLPECDASVAWNLDVPGRTLQMPQILAKAGVRHLAISRHAPGLLRWVAPDGSRVGVFSCGHYHAAGRFLHDAQYRALATLPSVLRAWESTFPEGAEVAADVPVIVSSDMSAPHTFDGFVSAWNDLRAGPQGLTLPEVRHGTLDEILPTLLRDDRELPEITGERPGVWAYLHGPCHHRASSAARAASELLPAAETFQTIAAVLAGGFDDYPAADLDAAWRALLLPDHGWGGRNGHVTDAVFLRSLQAAWSDGRRILRDALLRIARLVDAAGHDGDPLVVFNSLVHERGGTCEVVLDDPVPADTAIEVVDASGGSVPCQLERAREGRRQRFFLHADDVPSVGYRTYFLRTLPAADDAAQDERVVTTYENRYYALVFAAGGLAQIRDEELGVDLVDAQGLRAGELFSMHSPGSGAGEFARIQQATLEEFECASEHPGEWRLIEDGPVRAVFRWQGEFASCAYAVRVVLHHGEKRIDFDVRLLKFDGTPDREFRVAFPLALDGAQVAYEVPFGVVRIGVDEIAGAAGERYDQPCAEVRPRECRRWFGASDERVGVTIAASTAVFDHVDPTDPQAPCPVLQPVLLASRRSCHPDGNAYLQEGDHAYRFSLTSHAPGWSRALDFGERAARPLVATQGPTNGGSQPIERSFLDVEPGGVRVSTVKKHEDDDAVVIRCHESAGRDSRARIRWFDAPSSAARTDLLEEGGEPLEVRDGVVILPLGHHAIETLRMPAPPTGPTTDTGVAVP